MPELATNPSNVYLSLERQAFADFGGNRVDPISGMQALDATLFGGDLTSPTLSQFTLDLDAGQIILSFSEVVDFVVFDPSCSHLRVRRRYSNFQASLWSRHPELSITSPAK